MQPTQKPIDKFQTRDYMAKRQKDKTPPPSQEEMKRIIGRDLEDAARAAVAR